MKKMIKLLTLGATVVLLALPAVAADSAREVGSSGSVHSGKQRRLLRGFP